MNAKFGYSWCSKCYRIFLNQPTLILLFRKMSEMSIKSHWFDPQIVNTTASYWLLWNRNSLLQFMSRIATLYITIDATIRRVFQFTSCQELASRTGWLYMSRQVLQLTSTLLSELTASTTIDVKFYYNSRQLFLKPMSKIENRPSTILFCSRVLFAFLQN